MKHGAAIWLVALLFLVGLTPALASSALYHGDERFYTDAALEMERSGALFTPTYVDGTPRLNKPLLAYWLIVASHRLFGVGLLQSRLPFALAGAALVLGSGLVAARLARDGRAGVLAAALLASNPDVLALATRSTPDILVCAAVLLVFDALARLAASPEPVPAAAWELWLGAGLATAAKGLWGPLSALFALAFAARVLRRPLRPLLRGPALALGGALAVAASVPLFSGGGSAATEDQLRAGVGLASVFRNALEYVPGPWIHFLPWTLLLALTAWRGRAREVLAQPFARAALSWTGLLVLVFLFGAQRRVRYLAPASAPLAITLAWLLLACAEEGAPRLRGAALALIGLCALLAFATARVLAPAFAAAFLLGLGLACAVALFDLRRRDASSVLVAAAWAALGASLAYGLARATLARSPLPDVVACLRARGLERGPLGLAGLDDSLRARLRLLAGDALALEPVEPAQAGDLVLARVELVAACESAGLRAFERFTAAGSPGRAELWRRLRGAPPVSSADPTGFVLLARGPPPVR